MQKIVGVKRFKDGEIYYFLQNIDDLKLGDRLVVNFDDFQTVVSVVKLGIETTDEKAIDVPKILRRATESDIAKYESLSKKAKSYLPEIKKKSLELKLMMKFVSAEYSLDNSKILIVFSSEERVDFRALLKELASMLKIRIELKQIGQRDEVKCCGGVGVCGQECCCTRFLNDFEHVTVKMAKNQGLSLSPSKINGVCGRLLCCLAYESDMYEEILSKMPKINSEIMTPNGSGIVVYNDILRERVSVKRKSDGDTFVVEDFSLEEIRTGKREEIQEPIGSMAKLDEVLRKDNIVIDEKEQNNNQNVKNQTNNAQNNNISQNSNKNNIKNGRDTRQKFNNYQKNNKNAQNVEDINKNIQNNSNFTQNNSKRNQQNSGMTIVYENQDASQNNSSDLRKEDSFRRNNNKNKNFNNKRK